VDVSSEEEIYHKEEDVVCSQPVVPFVGMKFDSVEEARRVYDAYLSRWGLVSGLHHQGTILLLTSLLGRNLSAHMQEGQIVSRRTTLQLVQ
jgi:hypothetical protein